MSVVPEFFKDNLFIQTCYWHGTGHFVVYDKAPNVIVCPGYSTCKTWVDLAPPMRNRPPYKRPTAVKDR